MRECAPAQGRREFREFKACLYHAQRFDTKQNEHSKHSGCSKVGMPILKAPGAPGEGDELRGPGMTIFRDSVERLAHVTEVTPSTERGSDFSGPAMGQAASLR